MLETRIFSRIYLDNTGKRNTLHRVFHGIRLLRLIKRLVVVRQSIFVLYIPIIYITFKPIQPYQIISCCKSLMYSEKRNNGKQL